MPQPDYDPDDPDGVWGHVQETILNAVNSEDLEHRNCTPRSPCDCCPNFQNSELRFSCSSTNTAMRMSSSRCILLLDEIEKDPPPHAPDFAKNPPMPPD